jgi:hypothetical protein
VVCTPSLSLSLSLSLVVCIFVTLSLSLSFCMAKGGSVEIHSGAPDPADHGWGPAELQARLSVLLVKKEEIESEIDWCKKRIMDFNYGRDPRAAEEEKKRKRKEEEEEEEAGVSQPAPKEREALFPDGKPIFPPAWDKVEEPEKKRKMSSPSPSPTRKDPLASFFAGRPRSPPPIGAKWSQSRRESEVPEVPGPEFRATSQSRRDSWAAASTRKKKKKEASRNREEEEEEEEELKTRRANAPARLFK